MYMQEQHEWLHAEVSRRSLVTGAALGASAVLSPTLWQQSSTTRDPGIRGRHITYGSDPTTSLIIEFATAMPIRTAAVRLIAANREQVTAEPARIRTVRGSSRRYCRADFTGLQPDTAYTYEIAVDGRTIGSGRAETAFADRRTFRFTAFGDQGTGRRPRGVLARLEQLAPSLHLMCGDLCYADSSGQGGPGDVFKPHLWDSWLAQNDPAASHIPWLSVPGNHEMEPGFTTHGYAGYLTRVAPGGASPLEIPVASAFRVGSVGFVGLDSNDVSYEIPANRGWTRGAQTRWLGQTLARYRAEGSGIDQVVVFMHHAPYSTNNTHASEGGVIEAWVPLFDKYTVDLVISGHNHCYERVKPLRGGKVVGDGAGVVDSLTGTTYITAGGGGEGGEARFIPIPGKTRIAYAGGREVVNEDWSLPSKTATPSVLTVDVTPASSSTAATLDVRAIAADGHQLDGVRLVRGTPSVGSGSDTPWLIGGGAAAVGVGGAAALWVARHQRGDPSRTHDSVPPSS
ncbi:metallophosphoesterase family protein [Leekyejoonella antrihumi]